jgi:putative superfamily III holin-X
MDIRSPQPGVPSLAALLGGIMHDAKDVLVQELTLARLEGHDALRHLKTAALFLGMGVAVAAVGGVLLSVMLVHVLKACTDVPLWGCYGIVGSGFGVLGWVLLASGKHQVEAIDVMPQTVETMKENAQWLREQTTSDTISRRGLVPREESADSAEWHASRGCQGCACNTQRGPGRHADTRVG